MLTLINPAIGVETCVRLKREAAVRVAEGTTTLPTAPAGHVFLPLALLRRPVNQPLITNIESIRPFFHSPARNGEWFPSFRLFCRSARSPAFTQKLPEWRIGFSVLS